MVNGLYISALIMETLEDSTKLGQALSYDAAEMQKYVCE